MSIARATSTKAKICNLRASSVNHEWMTTKEAADYLKHSKDWIRDRVKSGDLPVYVMTASDWLFDKADIDTYIMQHRRVLI